MEVLASDVFEVKSMTKKDGGKTYIELRAVYPTPEAQEQTRTRVRIPGDFLDVLLNPPAVESVIFEVDSNLCESLEFRAFIRRPLLWRSEKGFYFCEVDANQFDIEQPEDGPKITRIKLLVPTIPNPFPKDLNLTDLIVKLDQAANLKSDKAVILSSKEAHLLNLALAVIAEAKPACANLDDPEEPIEWGSHLTDLRFNPKLREFLGIVRGAAFIQG